MRVGFNKRLWAVIALMLGLSAAPVSAQSFRDCKAAQQEIITSVMPDAENLAMRAAAAVGNTPQYSQWFGAYSKKYADDVRETFKRIHRAISQEEVVFICAHPRSPDCQGGTFAWVYSSEHYNITLCSAFFDMPRMAGGDPNDSAYSNGTMAGTFIHEISHFSVISETDDICYGRDECTRLPERDPALAIRNADSYQYFAEDVSFLLVAGTGNSRATGRQRH